MMSYYSQFACSLVEEKLLPTFIRQFTASYEHDWEEFLKQVKKEKKKCKRAGKKLFGDILEHRTFKEGLGMILHVLKDVDLGIYVRVPANMQLATTKIAEFEETHSLQPVDYSDQTFLTLLSQAGELQAPFENAEMDAEYLLYCLLYEFLYSMMKHDYNSVVRQLIKLVVTKL